jgi:two-component system, NtrC family, response regulator
MAEILIIDDDVAVCDLLCHQFNGMGYKVVYALTLEDGIKKVTSGTFDVLFLDVHMPDGDGLEILPEIMEFPSAPEVIIFTAEGNPEGAELAITSGAWDYIEKPLSLKEIKLALLRALLYREEKKKQKPRIAVKRRNIIGNSLEVEKCLNLVAEAAGSEENVLIFGETGTGKELFATSIHENSHRAKDNFIVVDCAILTDTLVESILFGHEKGAFTGAYKANTGLINQADRGTLFLDEVGELPLSIQKVFLRVLQEHRFRPLGGRKEINSDFRLVAATNKDLDEMVKSGQFREDLLYRLKSLQIELPPLRRRAGDINEIATNYITKLSDRYNVKKKGFSPDFFEALTSYEWPGNVRELLSILERTFVSSNNESILFARHLPTYIRINLARKSVSKENGAKNKPEIICDPEGHFSSFKDCRNAAIEEFEKDYFQRLIHYTGRDIKDACRISGLSRSRLYHHMKQYKLN